MDIHYLDVFIRSIHVVLLIDYFTNRSLFYILIIILDDKCFVVFRKYLLIFINIDLMRLFGILMNILVTSSLGRSAN